jgi:hypothetical protein
MVSTVVELIYYRHQKFDRGRQPFIFLHVDKMSRRKHIPHNLSLGGRYQLRGLGEEKL